MRRQAAGWVVVGYSHRRYYIAANSSDGDVPLYTVQGHLGEFESYEDAERAVRLRNLAERKQAQVLERRSA